MVRGQLWWLKRQGFIFQLCDHVWRPSRIESECIYGEGMDFLFPTEECNPFDDKQKGKRNKAS